MENTPKPMKVKVKVEEISKQSNEVYLNDGNGNEGWFHIKEPANIKWAKLGETEATIVGNAVTYLRSNSAQPSQNSYRPHTQINTLRSPEPATDYKPQEVESKRIGMTKELIDATLEEIRLMYNSMSIMGKWIVATNIFPRQDKPGKYDCMYFISEKREGFDDTMYMSVQEKTL